MKFVLPSIQHKQQAVDYIAEFHAHSSAINGTGGLDRFLAEGTYEEWLLKVLRALDIANVPQDKVPAYTYFYIREEDEKIVGMINIRLALTDFLRREGGHIGYSIRPTERRKAYGTKMLREALAFCKTIGLSNVVVTCDKMNIASAGMIKNCGGVLEEEFFSEAFNTVVQRYHIAQVRQC